MKKLLFTLSATLLVFSTVMAQTVSTNPDTRHQTIRKSNVLRKKATPTANSTNTNKGPRSFAIQRKKATDGSPRTQPMVTKPIIPPAAQ